jgi:hypothetical protein
VTAITTITIPSSVTAINSYAFWGCQDLTSVYFQHTDTLPIIASTNFSASPDTAYYNANVKSPDILNYSTAYLYLIRVFDTVTINTPVCYNYNTKILCKNIKSNKPEYVAIQDLRKGMLVKTYLDGYKKIEHIGKQTLVNNPLNPKYCMYKLRKANNDKLSEDLIVTYEHSILKPKMDLSDVSYGKIHDLYLVRGSSNKLFEKVMDNEKYDYFDFVLENDNDNERYGVWANGILSESCSKQAYFKHNFMELE